jgi:hypothetical protein
MSEPPSLQLDFDLLPPPFALLGASRYNPSCTTCAGGASRHNPTCTTCAGGVSRHNPLRVTAYFSPTYIDLPFVCSCFVGRVFVAFSLLCFLFALMLAHFTAFSPQRFVPPSAIFLTHSVSSTPRLLLLFLFLLFLLFLFGSLSLCGCLSLFVFRR